MNRTRLSLEPTTEDKQAIIDHGKMVGSRSIIGSIRMAVSRSMALSKLQRRGKLMLHRGSKVEEVEL